MSRKAWIIIAIIGFLLLMIIFFYFYNKRRIERYKSELKQQQLTTVGGLTFDFGSIGDIVGGFVNPFKIKL